MIIRALCVVKLTSIINDFKKYLNTTKFGFLLREYHKLQFLVPKFDICLHSRTSIEIYIYILIVKNSSNLEVVFQTKRSTGLGKRSTASLI